MDSKKDNLKSDKSSLSLKSSLCYGAAAASNIYFLFFGITFSYIPIIIFQTIVIALTIIFISIFINTRKAMFNNKKIVMLDTISLCLPIVLSVIIGILTVSYSFIESKLDSITNENLWFAIINLALVMYFSIKVSSRTKRWYVNICKNYDV